MRKEEIVANLREVGLVPVLRAESEEQALGIASAIADGGVNVLEITMTVPGAIDTIRQLAKRPDVFVGAGTVLDPETAKACIDAGAQFVVSPALNVHTVEACNEAGILCAPGALTPSREHVTWVRARRAGLPCWARTAVFGG